MFISGLLLALSVLLLLHKLPRLHKTALDHPAFSDVTITLAVVALGLISATFSGLLVGIIAGICLSAYFSIAPKLRDIKRPEISLNNLTHSPRKPRRKSIQDFTTITEIEEYLEEKQRKPWTYKSALREINK
jgi:hypothetical protein